jgi:ADP-ribose pyrophosphatase YjhB (NUDIX family)
VTGSERSPTELPCAGGVVFDGLRRLLVIQRGHEPSAGLWSIPGGRCLPDEDTVDTCVREVAEETGLAVTIIRLVGQVRLAAPGGGTYLVDDFLCEVVGGSLRAGDDAVQARWVTYTEFVELDTAPGLPEALREWDLLPR